MTVEESPEPVVSPTLGASKEAHAVSRSVVVEISDQSGDEFLDVEADDTLERSLRRKIDLRLCSIAGILCSLNLLDSGVISSAAVTSLPRDLDLTGNRFSIAIFIFTISSIAFQVSPLKSFISLLGSFRASLPVHAPVT